MYTDIEGSVGSSHLGRFRPACLQRGQARKCAQTEEKLFQIVSTPHVRDLVTQRAFEFLFVQQRRRRVREQHPRLTPACHSQGGG